MTSSPKTKVADCIEVLTDQDAGDEAAQRKSFSLRTRRIKIDTYTGGDFGCPHDQANEIFILRRAKISASFSAFFRFSTLYPEFVYQAKGHLMGQLIKAIRHLGKVLLGNESED
jgi:hypothetical protein